MSTNPYMPLYVADYLADTAHLTTLESGAYMLLIMHYWRRGGPLDNSNGRLANVARMLPDEWRQVECVLAEFFDVDSAGVWRHKRIDAELARAAEKSRKASSAGRVSAQRRLNGRSTDAQHGANLSESESESEYKSLPSQPSSTDAAREPAGWQALKSEFNGSTEAMLANIQAWMGPQAERKHAVNWLTGTLTAFGSERTARAWTIVTAKLAKGEPVPSPLPLWSTTARGLSDAKRPDDGAKAKWEAAFARRNARRAAEAAVHG